MAQVKGWATNVALTRTTYEARLEVSSWEAMSRRTTLVVRRDDGQEIRLWLSKEEVEALKTSCERVLR